MKFSALTGCAGLLLLCGATAAPATQTPEPSQTGQTGEREAAGGAEATSGEPSETIRIVGERPQQEVTLGSRIPRTPLFDKDTALVRSSTSLGGLSLGSGIDPYKRAVRVTKVKSCKSDHPALPDWLACDYGQVNAALDADDVDSAVYYLNRLEEVRAANAGREADDRRPLDYLIAQQRYRIADRDGDDAARLAALEAMVGTGQMTDREALSARRTIFALSMKAGARDAALDQALRIRAEAPEDDRNLANLAALYQQAGNTASAREAIRAAIAVRTGRGEAVPDNWQRLTAE